MARMERSQSVSPPPTRARASAARMGGGDKHRISRRRYLTLLTAAALIRPRAARAQADWPARPVRVMVPYPPAGGADTTARIVYARKPTRRF